MHSSLPKWAQPHAILGDMYRSIFPRESHHHNSHFAGIPSGTEAKKSSNHVLSPRFGRKAINHNTLPLISVGLEISKNTSVIPLEIPFLRLNGRFGPTNRSAYPRCHASHFDRQDEFNQPGDILFMELFGRVSEAIFGTVGELLPSIVSTRGPSAPYWSIAFVAACPGGETADAQVPWGGPARSVSVELRTLSRRPVRPAIFQRRGAFRVGPAACVRTLHRGAGLGTNALAWAAFSWRSTTSAHSVRSTGRPKSVALER